jgi:bleomycin hydrolase
VGFTRHAGRDWFLVKDSGRSSRWGRHRGYYFMRGDYARLKVLAFSVHRDAVKGLLKKFK